VIPLSEVLERSRRHNQEELYRVFPIVSRAGKVVTWLLVNLRVSANQTTTLFAIIAVASAALFSVGTNTAAIIAAILYWVQVVLDYSDGDIARFNQRFARNGEYWDHVIHLFAEPLVVAGVVIGEMRHDSHREIIAAGLLLVVVGAFNIGLTDVARLAHPNQDATHDSGETWVPSRFGWMLRLVSRAVGIGPFVLLYTLTLVIFESPMWHEAVIVGSAFAVLAASATKAFVIHRSGRLPGRADLAR
jgi:phosphatidylglycerophosphate synthase